jgi:hypothetical protein
LKTVSSFAGEKCSTVPDMKFCTSTKYDWPCKFHISCQYCHRSGQYTTVCISVD